MSDVAIPERPRLRGRLHQVAFICSIPAGITLVALGRTGAARAAVGVYAVSLMALYGISASYHRLNWSPRARKLMRRLDHSTIFILIAGSYTPLSILALRGAWRISILVSVWTVALVGVVLKLVRLDRMHAFGMVLYIALGWTAVIALPEVVRNVSAAGIALLFIGGILYTSGAIMFAKHKPDPNPRVFGYHEVWHSMVIGGTICHYTMIMMLALGAR
ncbi:MAG: hemolysin III family protein [Actinomycetota bacterium]|nr:hemolysin III family protein [Actinomycetota bacterium]